MNMIRAVVSGKRNRYKDEEYDLDLSYITPRIIAMAYPSTGYESMYRNPITEVARFLQSRHGDNYFVFNLSERPYDSTPFGNRVLETGFPDHFAPPMTLCWTVCKTIDAWMEAEPHNVAVIHCLAGKGRTGVVVACYLLYCGHVLEKYMAHARHPTGHPREARQSGPQIGGSKAAATARVRSMTTSALESTEEASLQAPINHASEAFNPFNTPAPALARSVSVPGAGASETAPAPLPSTTKSKPSSTFLLPPPGEMAKEALAIFKNRRGDGVKYPSQERTVRYFARIVHAVLYAENVMILEKEQTENETPEGALKSGTATPLCREEVDVDPLNDPSNPICQDRSRLSKHLENILKSAEIKTSIEIRTEALEKLRGLRTLPMPRGTRILVSRIILNGIPDIPGGFIPRLQITTAPYQGAETKIIYNSAWVNIVPAVYTPADGVVMFSVQAVMEGDVLIQVRQLPADTEIFRFSFQTTLMAHEDVHGVYRLALKDLDMEKRKSKEPLFPPGFFMDMIYELAGDHSPSAATSRPPSPKLSAGTTAAPPTALTSLPAASFESFSSDTEGAEDAGPGKARMSLPPVSGDGLVPASTAASKEQPPKPTTTKPITASKRPSGTSIDSATPWTASGTDDSVVCVGYLTKRGSMFKSWKRRWFVLRSSHAKGSDVSSERAAGALFYYETSKDTVPLGVVPLTASAIATLRTISGSDGSDPENKTAGRDWCFVIQREDRRHYFQADTERDMVRWMSAIQGLVSVPLGAISSS